jgi:hypothetical protein
MLSERSISLQAGEKFPATSHDSSGNGVVWFLVDDGVSSQSK